VNYPILFPQVAANIHYAASGNDLDFVRLASDLPRAEARLVGDCDATNNWCAGRSLHADWVNGWSPSEVTGLVGGDWGMSITDAIMQECYMILNNPAVPLQSDCHNNLIGSPLGDDRWWSF
jgi:hypothetical protein